MAIFLYKGWFDFEQLEDNHLWNSVFHQVSVYSVSFEWKTGNKKVFVQQTVKLSKDNQIKSVLFREKLKTNVLFDKREN